MENTKNNIKEQIKLYEEQQSLISEKLQELYELKRDENVVFRENLIGKYFIYRDKETYIKIVEKLSYNYFIIFEFNINFKKPTEVCGSSYNTFEFYTRCFEDSEDLENYTEISEEEYWDAYNKLVNKVKELCK